MCRLQYTRYSYCHPLILYFFLIGPTWASTNLGVFICMRCSGIHRSLGTHISKVKSTQLDNWQPYMVERMKTVGNLVGKNIYEHNVSKNYPRDFNDQQQLLNWIKNKYEYKKWFDESSDPDSKLYKNSFDEKSFNDSLKVNHDIKSPAPTIIEKNNSLIEFNSFYESSNVQNEFTSHSHLSFSSPVTPISTPVVYDDFFSSTTYISNNETAPPIQNAPQKPKFDTQSILSHYNNTKFATGYYPSQNNNPISNQNPYLYSQNNLPNGNQNLNHASTFNQPYSNNAISSWPPNGNYTNNTFYSNPQNNTNNIGSMAQQNSSSFQFNF